MLNNILPFSGFSSGSVSDRLFYSGAQLQLFGIKKPKKEHGIDVALCTVTSRADFSEHVKENVVQS